MSIFIASKPVKNPVKINVKLPPNLTGEFVRFVTTTPRSSIFQCMKEAVVSEERALETGEKFLLLDPARRMYKMACLCQTVTLHVSHVAPADLSGPVQHGLKQLEAEAIESDCQKLR